MSRERRFLFLTALVYSMYAVIGFIQQGAFLFPFPMNEVAITVVCVLLIYWNNKSRVDTIHLAWIGLFSLLGSMFFWEIVLSYKQLSLFAQGGWSDLFLLLYYLGLIVLIMRILLIQRGNLHHFLCAGAAALVIAGIILTQGLLLLPAYFLMTLSVTIKPVEGRGEHLWSFLLFFEAAKISTFAINSTLF